MALSGVSHVGLTVSDLAASKEWYAKVLQWQPQFDGEGNGTTFSSGQLPGGFQLVLRQHAEGTGQPFSERQPGLDHLSFACSRDDIDDLLVRLQEAGAVWSPVAEEPWGHLLNFRDPDNIALEFVAPPPQS